MLTLQSDMLPERHGTKDHYDYEQNQNGPLIHRTQSQPKYLDQG